ITGTDKSLDSALRRLVRPVADRARYYLILVAQIGGLLALLKISHGVTAINTYYGVALPVALALAMTRVRFAAADLAA
ncbi:hypothetical protein KZZ07_27480, partial [Mameliella sp. CS4]|uniref:hypothetical protein n=1 Tax=Mameliella sp. CS4 TaxID=2862329 RepID=UPI001C5E347E